MNHLINGPTNVLMINQTINELKVEVCSVVSDSLRPHGLYPTRLLCPWDFPGNRTGVDCHFLLHLLTMDHPYILSDDELASFNPYSLLEQLY